MPFPKRTPHFDRPPSNPPKPCAPRSPDSNGCRAPTPTRRIRLVGGWWTVVDGRTTNHEPQTPHSPHLPRPRLSQSHRSKDTIDIFSSDRPSLTLTPVWQKWHSRNMRWAGMLQRFVDQPETRPHFSVDYRNRYGILSAVNCSPSDQPKGLRRGYFFGGAE